MINNNNIKYTVEEIDELKEWFASQTLPKTMQITESAFSPDLSKTVERLFEQAYIYHSNFKMTGCVRLLLRIKQNMENK